MSLFHKVREHDSLWSMRFIEKIDEWLNRSGWTQGALERQAALPENRISKWRDVGEPTISQGLRIAKVLGIPLDYLADDTQDEPPPSTELSQDEQLALSFYQEMKRHEGSATVVLKVLARMASEGVVARPVAAQQRAAVPAQNHGSSYPGSNGGNVATGDSGVEELPAEPANGPRYGRVIAERDETEHHLRLERERKAKEREAARAKGKKPKR